MIRRAMLRPVTLAFFDNACFWLSGQDDGAAEHEGGITKYGFCSPWSMLDWLHHGPMSTFFKPMGLTYSQPEIVAPGVARSWLFRESAADAWTPGYKPKSRRIRIGAIYFYNARTFRQNAVPYAKRRIVRAPADLR